MKSKIPCLFLLLLFIAGCKKEEIIKGGSVSSKKATADLAAYELYPYGIKGLARVTGKTLPFDNFVNPSQTDVRFDVGGTDLGIMWDLGGNYSGIIFGDTFGRDWMSTPNGGGNGSNWRSNAVGLTTDTNLEDGMFIKGMLVDANGSAKQIIPSEHNTSGNGSFTSIPTAAVRINGVDYIHYMDIRQWGAAGQWTTNFSALYTTADNGQTWGPVADVSFSSGSNFAQAAYAKKDDYVYMIGTRSGRFGDAYVARFLQANIVNQAEYEFWVEGKGWVKNDETSATPIFNGPVGEVSLVYNTHFNRWIVAYLDEAQAKVVMRDAEEITGPWSRTKTLVNGAMYPGLYGAFIHPQKNNGEDLYFLMSMWGPYNVFLVTAKLKLQ